MSDSAMLVTSTEISAKEFYEFISNFGGVPGVKGRGVILDGETNIWVALLDIKYLEKFYNGRAFHEWTSYLASPPIAAVEMRLDHTDKSREAYLRFSVEFGKIWRSVLVDLDGCDLSYDMVCERYRNLFV